MTNTLSIRSYTQQHRTHYHDYHQLVLPIRGRIMMTFHDYQGAVAVGECVVIPAGQPHRFNADEAARFVVADLTRLPANMVLASTSVFSITPPLLNFLYFIEKQLEFQVHSEIEHTLVTLFVQLLQQQGLYQPVDPRIRLVQAIITERLADKLSVQSLANIACLSPTQFKKCFKQNLGSSVLHYITVQRMEKAKALLSNTDLPVQRIAEQVGYTDVSAFSRRFSTYFGLSPREFSR